MAYLHDLRFAVRSLAKNSKLSLVIVAILGLGIGATVAVLDVVNLLAWRHLPVDESHRLVRVFTGHLRGFSGPWGYTAYADYVDYRRDATVFTDLAAHRDVSVRLDTGEATQWRSAGAVSSNYFTALRLQPERGRFFVPDEHRESAAPVAVVSHRLWRQLGASEGSASVGSQIRIEGAAFTVVGVAPADYSGDLAGEFLDVFLPIEALPRVEPSEGLLHDRSQQRFFLTGRLAPGRSLAEAETQMVDLASRLDVDFPLEPGRTRDVTVLEARFAHPIDLERLVPSLKLFSGAVALLLLITCANVAHLLLAQAEGRRREIGIRQSLGAGRLTLVRQLLLESSVLAFAGGLLGLLVADWARAYLATFASPEFADAMQFDLRVLGGAVAVCGLATVLFGLAPALAGARTDLRTALADATPGAGGGRRRSATWLAAGQAALAVLLLGGGTLLGLSLVKRLDADLGFDDSQLLFAAVRLPDVEYTTEEGRLFFEGLRRDAEALPGVDAAATALFVPPMFFDITVPFRTPDEDTAERMTRLNYVSPEYFDTLDITLERGRLFSALDTPESAPAVIVNRDFAKTVWPGQDPLGQRLILDGARPDDAGPEFTVVGVVSSVDQFRTSFGGEPILYFPTAQKHRTRQQLILRTDAAPEVVFDALRGTLRAADPDLALTDLRTAEENRRMAYTFERMQTTAVGAFAGAGLLLAVIGLAAVLSYRVSRGVRAVGIRMAIGARRVDIRRQIVTDGLRWTAAGALAGLAAFIPVHLYFGDFFFEVGAVETAFALAAVVAVTLLTAAIAADIPARRAARLDPINALRQE